MVQGGRQGGPEHWFSTNETAHPAPWVELHLPRNVRLLTLQHYTFTHGHHRSSYFRYTIPANTLGLTCKITLTCSDSAAITCTCPA